MSVPQTATEAPPYAAASIRRQVEWVDTDASGHHHNSAILRWVEAFEAVLFHDLGLDDYFPLAPRVHQTVDFTTIRPPGRGRPSMRTANQVTHKQHATNQPHATKQTRRTTDVHVECSARRTALHGCRGH